MTTGGIFNSLSVLMSTFYRTQNADYLIPDTEFKRRPRMKSFNKLRGEVAKSSHGLNKIMNRNLGKINRSKTRLWIWFGSKLAADEIPKFLICQKDSEYPTFISLLRTNLIGNVGSLSDVKLRRA